MKVGMTFWAQTHVEWCERVIQTLIAYTQCNCSLRQQGVVSSEQSTQSHYFSSLFCRWTQSPTVDMLIWGRLKAAFNTPISGTTNMNALQLNSETVSYLYLKSLTDINYFLDMKGFRPTIEVLENIWNEK